MSRLSRLSLRLIGVLLAFTLFTSSQAHVEPRSRVRWLCRGFLPPNKLKIRVPSATKLFRRPAGGLSQEQFNLVIDRVTALYAPDIEARAGKIKIKRRWKDATVNASASRFDDDWILTFYGGMARHPAMTPDGFALVVCHELGHHLGGAPKYDGNWSSSEGQADYFATLKCLRRFLREDDAGAPAAFVQAGSEFGSAWARCEAQFSDEEEQRICMRSAMASLSVARVFAQISEETEFPRFETPDPSVVTATIETHPGAQCRLDTLFNGSLCNADESVPLSDTDVTQGACVRPDALVGLRPECWFHPD